MSGFWRLFWTMTSLGALSCGAPPSSGDAAQLEQSAVFIAFASDFRGFHDWQQYPVLADAVTMDPAHAGAALTEYINQRPPASSQEFPVGTIIAKEGSDGDPLTRQFFAMVKRGGNYNSSGAVGWEWFELQNATDGGVSIVWRGFGPPQGEIYGGNAKAGCNECHRTAAFDFVFAEQARP